MRGLAVLLAAGAGWTLAGAPLPRLRRPALPRLSLPLVAGAAATAVLASVLTLGLTATPSVAVAIGAMSLVVPFWRAAASASKARAATADAWPDVLAALRSRLGTGASLPESFVAATEQTPLESLGRMVEDGLVAGVPFDTLLERMRTELADPLADRVLTTIATAQRTGGARVGAIIGALGASVGDELRLRKAHQAALTQQRLTAAVALLAPWALLLLTITTNPQASSAYRETAGTIVVLGGLAATGLGYVLAMRTARLSRPPRLFQ